jgi:hypothetical protein
MLTGYHPAVEGYFIPFTPLKKYLDAMHIYNYLPPFE